MKIPSNYEIKGKRFVPMISPEEIEQAVVRIAANINNDYQNKIPIFLIVLKGSIIFGADLIRHIAVDCEIKTISAKSYGEKMESSGSVDLNIIEEDFKDKDLIIVEDIVDTGRTLTTLVNNLRKFEPKSIETASLLTKSSMHITDVSIKYVGFDIEPKFVIGYGLDYAEKGRHLPAIYVLDDEN